MTARGHGVSLWGEENILELDSSLAVQLCEYTKVTRLYTFKGEFCGMCIMSQLNKKDFQGKEGGNILRKDSEVKLQPILL